MGQNRMRVLSSTIADFRSQARLDGAPVKLRQRRHRRNLRSAAKFPQQIPAQLRFVNNPGHEKKPCLARQN
jgi:hypothetical protein